MKRWIWIPAMAPVMWGLLQLVIWADCLYAWQYSSAFSRPTTADFTRAAVVFWTASLTPMCVGLATAVVAFRRKYPPRWPVLEMALVALPYLTLAAGELDGIMWAHLFVGGTVVVILLNSGACARQRMWGKLALSAVALCAGMLYLFWLNAFIIYINT